MNHIEHESPQKLRGGYYTPPDLAAFIAKWVREISPKTLLEPSCGDGVFFAALAKVGEFQNTDVLGFELEPEEAKKAQAQAIEVGLGKTKILPEDFLKWAIKHFNDGHTEFDAIVGNPPFVRYQYLPKSFQAYAESVFAKLNLPFTKHTNAWVPFILASIKLLRAGGRLAMIVPAEIIHVTHAQSLRSYLGCECRRLIAA
jgi:adenine-specific DNA methylase